MNEWEYLTFKEGINKYFNNYKIIKEINNNISGSNYVAENIETNQLVFIKIYSKKFINKNVNYIELINNQIKNLKVLYHTNIIQLYEYFESNDNIYLIFEYFENSISLENFIKNQNNNKINIQIINEIFIQILSALLFMHNLKICHRNLELKNILINPNNFKIKIINFKYSLKYTENKNLTEKIGKFFYASPEIINNLEYNPEKNDVYSFGIILCLLLNGNLNEINIKKIKFINQNFYCLLEKILEEKQENRFNLNDIKNMFFQNNKNIIINGLNIFYIKYPIDNKILKICEKLNYNIENIKNDLLKNKFNKNTSIYKILVKKINSLNFQSISDFQSEFFFDYINNINNYFVEPKNYFLFLNNNDDIINNIKSKIITTEKYVYNSLKIIEEKYINFIKNLEEKNKNIENEMKNKIENDLINNSNKKQKKFLEIDIPLNTESSINQNTPTVNNKNSPSFSNYFTNESNNSYQTVFTDNNLIINNKSFLYNHNNNNNNERINTIENYYPKINPFDFNEKNKNFPKTNKKNVFAFQTKKNNNLILNKNMLKKQKHNKFYDKIKDIDNEFNFSINMDESVLSVDKSRRSEYSNVMDDFINKQIQKETIEKFYNNNNNNLFNNNNLLNEKEIEKIKKEIEDKIRKEEEEKINKEIEKIRKIEEEKIRKEIYEKIKKEEEEKIKKIKEENEIKNNLELINIQKEEEIKKLKKLEEIQKQKIEEEKKLQELENKIKNKKNKENFYSIENFSINNLNNNNNNNNQIKNISQKNLENKINFLENENIKINNKIENFNLEISHSISILLKKSNLTKTEKNKIKLIEKESINNLIKLEEENEHQNFNFLKDNKKIENTNNFNISNSLSKSKKTLSNNNSTLSLLEKNNFYKTHSQPKLKITNFKDLKNKNNQKKTKKINNNNKRNFNENSINLEKENISNNTNIILNNKIKLKKKKIFDDDEDLMIKLEIKKEKKRQINQEKLLKVNKKLLKNLKEKEENYYNNFDKLNYSTIKNTSLEINKHLKNSINKLKSEMIKEFKDKNINNYNNENFYNKNTIDKFFKENLMKKKIFFNKKKSYDDLKNYSSNIKINNQKHLLHNNSSLPNLSIDNNNNNNSINNDLIEYNLITFANNKDSESPTKNNNNFKTINVYDTIEINNNNNNKKKKINNKIKEINIINLSLLSFKNLNESIKDLKNKIKKKNIQIINNNNNNNLFKCCKLSLYFDIEICEIEKNIYYYLFKFKNGNKKQRENFIKTFFL